MSAMDTYQSLARGTIDGLLFAYQSLRPSKIETIAKYALNNVGFGSAGIIWMISDATWQKLPEDVRGIMLQAGEETERSFCAFMDKNEASEAEALRAGGMTFTTMDETDLTKVTASFASTDQEWANKLDSRDKPGSAVLAAFKAAASPAHQ
jgi:TRAP-type C4-dicarboxylate transport system substrate-binding protein